jgi:hypothetical protein
VAYPIAVPAVTITMRDWLMFNKYRIAKTGRMARMVDAQFRNFS